MQVILLERIENLGQMGDVVNVKPGYARNFLLPQHKALRATEENLGHFENRRQQLEAENLEKRKEAEAVAGRLDGLDVTVIRSAGDSGQLYGSVTARDIADVVTEAGFSIARQQVVIDRPVKALGFHDFRIRLHPEVDASITVNVARSQEEAEVQAKLGRAIISADEEPDEALEDEVMEIVADEDAPEAAELLEPEALEAAEAAEAEEAPESAEDDAEDTKSE